MTVPFADASVAGAKDATPAGDAAALAPDASAPTGGSVRIRVHSAQIHSVALESERAGTPLFDCDSRTIGACVVSECTQVGDRTTSPRAGRLTLRGGLEDLDIDNMGNGFQFSQKRGEVFAGGETLTIATAGEEAPAASFMITAPDFVRLMEPAIPRSGAYTLDRSADMPVSWTPSTDGELVTVRMDVQTMSTPLASTAVNCSYPMAAGAGVIPRDALLALPATPMAAYFGVEVQTVRTIDVGDYRFTTTVSRFALDARSGEISRGGITIAP